MFQKNISKAAVNELPLKRYTGKIITITNADELPAAFQEINQHNIVGFDTETKPVFVKGQSNPVALIQIATSQATYLIRINKTGVTQEIIEFLENQKIQKMGVGLRDDLIDLQKLKPCHPQGFFELNELVNQLDIEANGLRKLTAIILGFRISKNAQVSNWEAEVLNEKQKRYAATDAWVCLAMFEKLKDKITF